MAFDVLSEVLLGLGWLVALSWVWRVAGAVRNLPGVPNLNDPRYDGVPLTKGSDHLQSSLPTISVIVPACNEETSIGATLESLLAIEGVAIEIVAIDDRSTDQTGAIMDALAERQTGLRGYPALRVIHVTDLPAGWLGKPHAMAMAARETTGEWLLFTDGDVLYRPDVLRRAMQYLATEPTDHLVLYPTLILKLFGERMVMSCIQSLSIWAVRPWKIADPQSLKDSIGVGAFNMVRRDVYDAVGGYEALRMEVLDDLRLGYKIKHAGYRQRVVFGRDLIRIRWAVGADGILRNLTKNAFAVFQYRAPVLLGACCGLAFLSLMPLLTAVLEAPAAAGISSLARLGPLAVQLVALWMASSSYKKYSGIPEPFVLAFPAGVCLLIYAMLRSMVVTLRQGGVPWRGTLYPLSELRKHVGPVR